MKPKIRRELASSEEISTFNGGFSSLVSEAVYSFKKGKGPLSGDLLGL